MQRRRFRTCFVAGVAGLLCFQQTFVPLPFGKGERTGSKQAENKELSALPAWSDASQDSRRLRSAIESILREQQALREEAPLVTGGTIFSVLSAAALATLAHTAWVGTAALPVIASAIFSYTSVAESSGTKSLGLGRCSFSQALADAAEQERKLAVAEVPKALLPFGAGCTAIFAAVCVTLKIFEEDPANLGSALPTLGWPSRADSFPAMLGWLFCFGSVVGAAATNDQALLVISKLRPQLRNPLQDEDENEVIREMEDGEIEVGLRARVLLAFLSIVLCFVPLFLFEQNPSTQSLMTAADEVAVIVSASAAAQTAFSFLLAEKSFADAERRIAAQSRQAALSELFFAQAQADAAVLAPNSAMSATSLGLASVAAEFSKTLSSGALWPAVASTFYSTVSALTSRAEADAAYLENEASKRALEGMEANVDTVSAAISEFQQLQRDLSADDLSENIRIALKGLSVGETREFRGLSRDQRRKVHLLAAELGMVSQSFGSSFGPSGRVTRNVLVLCPSAGSPSLHQEKQDPFEAAQQDLQRFLQTLTDEGKAIQKTLVQGGWVPVAGMFVLGSAASPVLLGRVGAELLLPLATGTVGLATAWQETAGKGAVAVAKRQTAFLLTKEAQAETLLGRAQLAYAAFPTDVAIATLATTATVLSAEMNLSAWWKFLAMLAVIPAYMACLVAMHRRRKVERYVAASMRCVDAKPIRVRARTWKQRCWILPLLLSAIFPCDLCSRATIACATFAAEIALGMAESSQQLANATGSLARAGCVVATADAWSQLAQFSARALPARTSLAVVSTLMATALVEYSLPVCALFPAFGAAVFVRSLQLNRQSQQASAKLEEEFMDMQVLRKVEPWARLRSMSDSSNRPERSLRPKGTGRISVLEALSPMNVANRALRGAVRLKKIWEDRSPAEAYKPAPAVQAVRSVQANLNEIRSLTRYTRSSWFRTFSVVGLLTLASVVQPWILFSSSEVVLPVAGAVKAADLKSATSTMEEFTASAMQFRSFLLAAAGCTAATCVLALISIKPWVFSSRLSWLQTMQHCWSFGLVVFHLVAAGASMLPLQAVLLWTSKVKLDMPASRSTIYPPPLRPGIVSEGPLPKGSRWCDLWCRNRWTFVQPFLATLPGILLAVLPPNRTFEDRAVASTAVSSFVVAGMLFLAERALFHVELLTAGRRMSFALTDTLANEAEQQSALLPVATAATIAVSAAVTFGVELNPFGASALALVQAVTWILASRKALQARFGSDAAIQASSVTESRMARPGRPLKESPSQRGQWRSFVSVFSRSMSLAENLVPPLQFNRHEGKVSAGVRRTFIGQWCGS
ncbi:Oxygen-independent coproporphyrinogen-III oxidase-like protein [Durusdinium trenchii]|uniref:Oxygen-independent coproporphyrinogen-III oxidase-like protein n=1 Tax=Durusdinium trenchii TaxID=1381693 RepID=A0ABP0RSB0_9DINO